MARGLTMSPALWGSLPNDLIDIIIHKILVDLPFSRHWSFCRVSKRWRDFLLSNHYLVYHHMGQCKIYNSRRSKWEWIPLNFGQWRRKRLNHMVLVSADGGLLTFFDTFNSQILVRNPFTKRYIKSNPSRGSPLWSHEESLCTNALAHSMQVAPHPEMPSAYEDCWKFCVLRICTNRNKQPFRISTCSYHKGVIAIMDSRFLGGTRTADLPQGDFWAILNGPILQSPRALILGFSTGKDSKALIYEIKSMRCSWTATDVLLNAIKSIGKVLAICSDREARLKLFEVHGTGLTMELVESPSPPLLTLLPSLRSICVEMTLTLPDHLKRLIGKKLLLCVACSGEGDAVHYVADLRGRLGPGEGQGNVVEAISVRTDLQQRSNHSWIWKLRPKLAYNLSSPMEFYVFKPSMAAGRP